VAIAAAILQFVDGDIDCPAQMSGLELLSRPHVQQNRLPLEKLLDLVPRHNVAIAAAGQVTRDLLEFG
jgi:hypothetical protein